MLAEDARHGVGPQDGLRLPPSMQADPAGAALAVRARGARGPTTATAPTATIDRLDFKEASVTRAAIAGPGR
jgi:hypothetical protein